MKAICFCYHILQEVKKNMSKCKKLHQGIYEYRGYRICNCGYHEPDHCIWWEAVDIKTGCADYHANTKKEIIEMIERGE